MTDTDTAAFPALPVDSTADGDPRRTGVEIEFSGLSASEAARIAAQTLGGTVRSSGENGWTVEGSEVGTLDLYLDTALRHATDSPIKRIGLDIGKELIPVEIVTEPLTRQDLPRLDRLRSALREAGAEGTRKGVTYGFGVHLNIGIASTDAAGITAPLIAYAVTEAWMRRVQPIDLSRQVLPFTDPYPTRLVRALCQAGFVSPTDAMDIYLEHANSRNYGLDMLPIFAWLESDRVDVATGGESAVKGRPAFHFRLPDCQIDDADWSIRAEWDRWLLVETIAQDTALLDRLMREWDAAHSGLTLRRSPWANTCGDILAEAGVFTAEAAA